MLDAAEVTVNTGIQKLQTKAILKVCFGEAVQAVNIKNTDNSASIVPKLVVGAR
jgi:hypothetical protein